MCSSISTVRGRRAARQILVTLIANAANLADTTRAVVVSSAILEGQSSQHWQFAPRLSDTG
jgi:hypothetical protein